MVFGTGAVIATLSSNEGAAQYIKAELEKSGTKIVRIRPDDKNRVGVKPYHKAYVEKYSKHFESLSFVKAISGAKARYRHVLKGVNFYGVGREFFDTMGLSFTSGRSFDSFENDNFKMVGVLGFQTKKDLFGDRNAIGEYVYLAVGKVTFVVQVAGVLKEKGGDAGQVMDTGLFMPQNVAEKLGPPDKQRTMLIGKLVDENKSTVAKYQVLALLGAQFSEGLHVSDAREAIERTKGIWEKQNLVGICLALISLLTGGVGIMNIMLLSVAQRKKEIGLRKAVGAQDSHIMIQFLLESVIVCIAGGALGIMIGMLFGQQVAQMMGQWDAVVSMGTVGLALGFATLTGVVFGLAPAQRASKMEPYEALRA